MTYQGTVKHGVVKLPPEADLPDGTKVRIEPVNSEDSGGAEQRLRSLNPAQLTVLRARLASFAEEWESPEMDMYDDYDAAKANL